MEQLFAVRVLVHYHDKSTVDHAAARRLLSAASLHSLQLLLDDGTTISLSDYIKTPPNDRKTISDVIQSCGSTLIQVASVFMLAEARAAADALPTSHAELETACNALERLLACLATKRPRLPVTDIKQSARVKFGTAARRRAIHRLCPPASQSNHHDVSILKAVNAILRLCDVATHCLAVVSRQCISSKSSCQTAVALSTRLLTLAASSYEVQRADAAPALSFFSTNSLRTALVAGAMHLGAIAIEHLEIEPMSWIHVANRIAMTSGPTIAPRTSVLSALFGGMIQAGKRYESVERDLNVAEGAVCLLSTLHVILETDMARDAHNSTESHHSTQSADSSNKESAPKITNPASSVGAGPIAQAARSFLGERVVAAEEDGDEGRIAARTVYQACEEYAIRAGESDGMMGLLSRLFIAAGRQCRQESIEEQVVSISEGTPTSQPDESDASSDGPNSRAESPPFTLDVFDQRSKDSFAISTNVAQGLEADPEQAERIERHREVGALALDTLAHWVSRSHSLQQYAELDFTEFSVNVCQSAGFFYLSNSSASYDLRAAMADFGSLIGPILVRNIGDLPSPSREMKWSSVVRSLTNSCQKINPILTGVLSCSTETVIIRSLLTAFFERKDEPEYAIEPNIESSRGLPSENVLTLLLSLLSEENAVEVVDMIANHIITSTNERDNSYSSLSHRTSSLIILSDAISLAMGIREHCESTRIAISTLYNRDSDGLIDPILPRYEPEKGNLDFSDGIKKCSEEKLQQLVAVLGNVPNLLDSICQVASLRRWKNPIGAADKTRDVKTGGFPRQADRRISVIHYHFFWGCLMLQKSLHHLDTVHHFGSDGVIPSSEDVQKVSFSSPFLCMKALRSPSLNKYITEQINERAGGSLQLLYTAECMAILHPLNGKLTDHAHIFSDGDMVSFISSVLMNSVDILSDYVSEDVTTNFTSLRQVFEKTSSIEFDNVDDKLLNRPPLETNMTTGLAMFSCLQLAMCYVRAMGISNMTELLGDAIISVGHLLDRLNSEQLSAMSKVVFEVSKFVIILPQSSPHLSRAILWFLERFIVLTFESSGTLKGKPSEVARFIARVSGLNKIMDYETPSAFRVHLFCKFAQESGSDNEFDQNALRVALGMSEVSEEYGSAVAQWLTNELPKFSLKTSLSTLLIPLEESAVAVSAHAQSLSFLTQACESGDVWRTVTIDSLCQLLLSDETTFGMRMIRRSVMQSATLNDGLLAVFERIVGANFTVDASRILLKLFEISKKLFCEEADISLESRIRLLNFIVRVSICYGRISRGVQKEQTLSPLLLEPTVFELVFNSLQTVTAKLQSNPGNKSAKHLVFFLCSLLESMNIGLNGDRQPYFAECFRPKTDSNDTEKSEPLDVPKLPARDNSTNTTSESENVSSKDPDVHAPRTREDVENTALCTYTTTGSQFVEQHWYFCYTCDLAGSEGVCSVCARVCHEGCELAYSKFSRFFCDCGAGSDPQQENASHTMSASEDGEGSNSNSHEPQTQSLAAGQFKKRKSCKCLKDSKRLEVNSPPKPTVIDGPEPQSPSIDRGRDIALELQLHESLVTEFSSIKKFSLETDSQHWQQLHEGFRKVATSPNGIDCILKSVQFLIEEIDNSHSQTGRDKSAEWTSLEELNDELEKCLVSSSSQKPCENRKMAKLTRLLKNGSFEATSKNNQDDRTGSLISYSSFEKILAVGDQSGVIEFVDAKEALTQTGGPLEKLTPSHASRASVAFEIRDIQFHPENSNLLLVTGRDRVVVLARNVASASDVWRNIDIEIGLSQYDGSNMDNRLIGASWVEGQDTMLIVITAHFVKLFDVASDTFSPCFFAKVPSIQEATVDANRNSGEPVIIAACLVPIVNPVAQKESCFVLVVTSENNLFICHGSSHGTQSPKFVLCGKLGSGRNDSRMLQVSRMAYLSTESSIVISYRSGLFLCLRVSFRIDQGQIQASFKSLHLCDEIEGAESDMQFVPVPGVGCTFIFFRKGEALKSGGVFHMSQDGTVAVHSFSGNASGSFLGLSPFSPSHMKGEPALGGSFLVLDDGSLHRVDLVESSPRLQKQEESVFSRIVEARRLRALKSRYSQKDSALGYNPVPETVGFFEKCRLVSESITIEGLDIDQDPSLNYERMGVTLAGSGGDCVLSAKENEPLRFTARIENQSLVVVGARLRFGGTDRSRNRVPAEVKAFGRTVKWSSQNGVKRWLDIPLSVPESIRSPQKVSFELTPRLAHGDGRTTGDGFVALDSLELFAVSTIEFTERKLLFESEKSQHLEKLQKQREASHQDKSRRYPNLSPVDFDTFKPKELKHPLTQDQAAILALLSIVDGTQYQVAEKGGNILLEINNLWSTTFDGSKSRDPTFLEHILKPCVKWCAQNHLLDQETSAISILSGANIVLSQAVREANEAYISQQISNGALPKIGNIEKCLFSLGGLARALISCGCALDEGQSSTWIRSYGELLPSDNLVDQALLSHDGLGRTGRALYKSSYSTTIDVIDIIVARLVRDELNGLQSGPNEQSTSHTFLLRFLCSLDQRMRLSGAQRLIELFDSPHEATMNIGSPVESVVASLLVSNFRKQSDQPQGSQTVTTEPEAENDDADNGTQRWAYRCDSCGKVCEQEWWHCNDCEDFDLCTHCLRSSKPCVQGSHREDHILIRGSVADEGHEQSNADGREEQISPASLAIQRGIRGLTNEFLSQVLNFHNDSKGLQGKWRFLDAVETIAQLLSSHTPAELRIERLKGFFESSFVPNLHEEMKRMAADLKALTNGQQMSTNASQNSGVVFLMLRVLLAARGSTTPAHLHKHNIPMALFSLLEAMHERMRTLVRKGVHESIPTRDLGPTEKFMSLGVWNNGVPGLSYDLLAPNGNRRQTGTTHDMDLQVAEDLGLERSIFLNVMIATLQVLDYSFRSAASSLITEQMRSLPRYVLCDIINFCETISPTLQDSSLLQDVASTATKLLSTLSLDNRNAVNEVLDKYLYKEQCSRLKGAIEAHKPEDRLISYDTAIEIASILENLHRAACRHPATWRSFVIDNEHVLSAVYDTTRICEGQMQVKALCLIAGGVAVSEEYCCKVMRNLPLLDHDGQDCPPTGTTESILPRANTEDGVTDVLRNHISLSDLIHASGSIRQTSSMIFKNDNFQILDFFVQQVMLKSQIGEARDAAANTVSFAIARAAAESENDGFVRALHSAFVKGLESMPYAGDLASSLMLCLRLFIEGCQEDIFGLQSQSLLTSLTAKITWLLKSRCNLLVSHPNARLYGRLSGILDLDGYYLEADPCTTCSSSMWDASERRECRLDAIRAETKYTDSAIMHRLAPVHEISSISVKVVDPRRSRRVKRIDVLYSSRTVADAAELKNAAYPWKRLRSLELGATTTEARVDLIVPVATANIKFHFAEFHSIHDVLQPVPNGDTQGRREDNTAAPTTGSRRGITTTRPNENLQCPRCSRSVTDRHGICRNCHENAYQCRQCRNINYENLDGFLCNECGYCKHGRFEFSITGKPTHVAESIQNEEDRKKASKIIEKETGNVHRCMEQLKRTRSNIIQSLVAGIPVEETKDRTKPHGTTRIGLADLFDSVVPRSDMAVLEAILEGQTSQDIEETANSAQGVSVTEDAIADNNGSADASDREQNTVVGRNVAPPLGRSRGESQSKSQQSDGTVISRTTSSLAVIYAKECRAIFSTMSRGIRVLAMTRAELVRYANTIGGRRLQYANDIDLNTPGDVADVHAPFLLSEETRKVDYAQTRRSACCYGCTQSFISKCVRLVQAIMKRDGAATSIIHNSDLSISMLQICSLCEKTGVRDNIRNLITYLVNDNIHATELICKELANKIEFCIDSFETIDSHSVARFEMAVLESTANLDDCCWEERLRLVTRILFKASKYALTCSSVAESIILPCLRVALRLMRSDSELVQIESVSAVEAFGSVTDAASHEGFNPQTVENSETETEDVEQNIPVNLAQESLRSPDVPVAPAGVPVNDQNRRIELDEDMGTPRITVNAESHEVAIVGLTDGHLQGAVRETLRVDERRPSIRVGSDLMSGSGAPSSVGTAFDGPMSDEEVGDSQNTGQTIDMATMNKILENNHDSKLLTADVSQWLEGKYSHSAWIADMKERAGELLQREKPNSPTESFNNSLRLKSCFQGWKRVGRENVTNDQDHGSDGKDHPFHKLSVQEDNWIVRLMLFTPCESVRREACTLLELICGHEENLQLQLLDVLTGPALSLAADVGENSKEFFDLLETTLTSRSHRRYLIAKQFLPRLAALIRSRAERLICLEAAAESSLRLVNFLEGYSLKRLLSVLRQTLEVIPPDRTTLREKLFEVDNNKLVLSLQRAYICVRKLISLRTRLTDDSGSQLCEVLLSKDFLFVGPTVPAVVSACVAELKTANERNDAQAVAILLEQLCLMLCPERKEPVCFLALNKAPTQEEYIRGSMSRNPYPSTSFDGPLMRDVKNKICKDLDLPGLLEDDFAMELLVAGNVVKLDLPIMAVYEHVWKGSSASSMASSIQPAQISRTFGIRRAIHTNTGRSNGTSSRSGGLRSTILSFRRLQSERDSLEEDTRTEVRADPPMVVVYRLSGLDGEATEPIVDSLPTETGDEQDMEELYGDTIVFGEVGGLEVLFKLLGVVGSWGDDAETVVRVPALRLLRASCEVAQNRALLAKSAGAVSTLLDCAASAFEHAQGSPAAVLSAESLLIAAEQILAQQLKELETRTAAASDEAVVPTNDPEEVMGRVRVFLGRLAVATSPKAENSILHLLPFLIQGVPGAIDLVLEHFFVHWDCIDANDGEQQKARQLGTVLSATPRDLRGNAFASRAIETKIGNRATEYISARFPIPRSEHKEKWEDGLQGKAPPLVLRLLTGLSLFLRSDGGPQSAGTMLRNILQEQTRFVPALCQLEMAVSENSIGTTTEELLEALARDDEIREEIEKERSTIRKARREAALASRVAILQETGLSVRTSDGFHTSAEESKEERADSSGNQKSAVMELIDELPDEVGPSCVVCGDGFMCRPEEALSFYVFCKKVPLDLLSESTQGAGSRAGSESGTNQGGSARLDWELWCSSRARGSSGLPSRSNSSSCYTTVTHLNAIHPSCHKEAARVDRGSRRDEWDGASLRNSQTRCNNMFPVRPPITFKQNVSGTDLGAIKSAKASYTAAVDGYFGRLSSLGRTSLSQSNTTLYDLGRSMLRFAEGGSAVFSEHSKGGGPHSNACLIPHMVQLAIYIIEMSGPARNGNDDGLKANEMLKTQEAALSKYLRDEEAGDITYYLASALVLRNLEEWNADVVQFVKRGMRKAGMKSAIMLRLVGFSDLINRVMKSDIVVTKDEHWLEGLARHIGSDETFAERFGDTVNERWEHSIRQIEDWGSMVAAISSTLERLSKNELENELIVDSIGSALQ